MMSETKLYDYYYSLQRDVYVDREELVNFIEEMNSVNLFFCHEETMYQLDSVTIPGTRYKVIIKK